MMRKKIKQGTSSAKLKKINRRCVTEKTCDAKRLLQELCDRFKVISVKFLFYFDQKEATPPCGHFYGRNLQLHRQEIFVTDFRRFGSFEYHRVTNGFTFHKINFLMVFIKADGSNIKAFY